MYTYEKFKKQYPGISKDELLKMVLKSRMEACRMWGFPLLSETEQEEMIKEANSSFFKLTLLLIEWENPELLKARFAAPEVYRESLEVIEEITARLDA